MSYSLSFHIIGIVMWLGGLIVLSRVLTGFESNGPEKVPFAQLVRRIYLGSVMSGVAIVVATGVYQVLEVGLPYYMKQGWFHGKLTAVVILLVITHVVGGEIRKACAGQSLSKKRVMGLHGISALILILVVVMTKVSTLP